MMSKITNIQLEIINGNGAVVLVWRGMAHRLYGWITPASFARVQRAQAAIMKDLFGRAK